MERLRTVFLEVGAGIDSVPEVGNIVFGPEKVYVGIAPKYHNITEALERGSVRIAGDRMYITANNEKLPLPDSSVDEIFFGDIFGNIGRFMPERYANMMFENLLREARRVLKKPSSILTILETKNPTVRTDLNRVLERKGFKVTQVVTGVDAVWLETIAPYNSRSLQVDGEEDEQHRKYLLFAHPVA